MAVDFGENDVPEIGQAVTPKGGLSVEPTQMPSPYQPAAAGFSGASDTLGKVLDFWNTSQQQQEADAQNKFMASYTSEVTKISDAVDQGQLTSAQATSKIRALSTQYIAANPQYQDSILGVNSKLLGDNGLAHNILTGNDDQQQKDKMQSAELTAAQSAGYINPGMTEDQQAAGLDQFREGLQLQASAKRLQDQYSAMKSANDIALEPGRVQAEQARNKGAVISLQTTQAQAERARLELKGQRLAIDVATHGFDTADTQLESLSQQYRNGQIDATAYNNGVANVKKGVLANMSQAASMGFNTSSLMSQFDNLTRIHDDYATGKADTQTTQAALDAHSAKVKLAALQDDPQTYNKILLLHLIPQGAFGTDTAIKTGAGQVFKNAINTTAEVFTGNTIDHRSILGPQQSVSPNINQVANVFDQADHNDPKALQQIDTGGTNIISTLTNMGPSIKDPTQFQSAVNLVASPSFGKWIANAKNRGALPPDALSNLTELFRQNYQNGLIPAVQKSFQQATMQSDAGANQLSWNPDTGISADQAQNYKDLIEPQLVNGVVKFVPKGDVPTDKANNMQSVLQNLNSSLSPIVTQQIRLQSNLTGDTQEKTWEDVRNRFFPNATPQQDNTPDPNYGNRPDGTAKGNGFFGPLQGTGPNEGDVMTEYSVGVEINGKEMDVPTFVPTMTKKEIDYLRNGGEPTDAIVRKAADYAKQRLAEGKPVFATKEEWGKYTPGQGAK